MLNAILHTDIGRSLRFSTQLSYSGHTCVMQQEYKSAKIARSVGAISLSLHQVSQLE